MRMHERMKKYLSILLCLCMLVQNCPVVAFAAETDNLCEHHTEHTADCGYAEGSAGSPCIHEHSEDCYEIVDCKHTHSDECDDPCTHECTVDNGCIIMELDCHHVHGDCGYSEGTAEVPCGHVHNESCGYAEAVAGNPCANAETDPECDHSGDCGYVAAIEGQPCGHTACDDTCGYAPATEGTPCTHVCEVKVNSVDSCYKLLCSHKGGGHDDACGYAAAVSGSACTFHCQICHVQELVDALPGEVTAENAEAVAAQLTAIDNEKASLSDEELAQVDFAKYTAAAEGLGSVYAAVPAVDPTCTCETKCAGDSVNGDCEVCAADLTACIGEKATADDEDGWFTVSGNTLTIDGTLGGKTTAEESDITALVDAIKGYVDSGITTMIVTGSEPALYNLYDVDTPAVSVALFSLVNQDPTSSYCGTIDLILPDVTEIVDSEFNNTFALNSIDLPKVTKLGDLAFYAATYLRTITFGSVLTEVDESGGVMFASVGKEVGGCDLILNCGQMNESSVSAPDLSTNIWKFRYENEFKSITLTHTEGTAATCTAKATCSVCGDPYGEVDGDAHNYGAWTSNGDNTHTRTCANESTHTENGDCSGGTATCKEQAVCDICKTAYGTLGAHTAEPTYAPNAEDSTQHDVTYSCCGATVTEAHTMNVTTGKCGECGADMTVVATVTDGSTTLSASDAATLNQAVTAILETGSRTFTVNLPADAPAEMITAIRRAICDTEGVADGSINLTLKGVTSIPGTTNRDGVAFCLRYIYDEAGEIVDTEEVTQLASVNLPDVTDIGALAFYYCKNLASVSAPKAQTIGEQALGYTALTSVEFPELTTIPLAMFDGIWTLSSAKLPKVTTIEQGGLLIGALFKPENNPTPFPLELTAEGDITFNGSYHFNLASQNYSGKVDLVLCCDKKDAVTFHDDGTATWQVRNDLSYTFKSITFKHSYVDGKCEFCKEDCTHTGGEATCTTLAVCDTCGASYGELGNHSTTAEDDRAATCKELAYCSVCQKEFGEFDPNNHISDVYTYTDNGDGTHTKTHECGVTVGEPENHTIENHVCTACGAMEITVSFNAGDYKWETGDKLYFCRVSRDNQWEEYCFTATVAEDGTVTWTPDKTLYWDGTGEHRLIVSYPCTDVGWDDFAIQDDQSEVEKLKKADCMNARWVGAPTTNVINFELTHRMAKVTVNYEVAEDVTTEISDIEVYSNSKYCIFRDADGLPILTSVGQYDVWVTPYQDGNQFTAFVSPDAYAADGNFIKITLSDGTVYEVKMNKAVTFAEGAEYTYKVIITADGAYLVCADGCSFEYTANEDGLTHSKTCSKCGYVAASENHTATYSASDNVISASCSKCKADLGTATITAENTTYNGTEQKTATVDYSDGWQGGTLTVSYANNVNAGTATASITIEGKTASVQFTITKADSALTAPAAITGLTYNGSDQALVTEGEAVGGTLQYSLDNVSWSAEIPTAANAGEHTVYYMVVGNDNYNGIAAQSLTVTIGKATTSIAFDHDYNPSGEYNGVSLINPTAGSVNITGATYNDVVFTWYKDSVAEANKLSSAPKDAGTYYVVASIPESNNTSASSATSNAITISPMEVTAPIITLTQNSFAYDGMAKTPAITSVVYQGHQIPASEYTVSYSNNINVGTATVTITDKDGGNFTVSGSTTFEITKAAAVATAAPTPNDLTYTGQAQNLINGGEATGGTMQYSTDNQNWSTTIPQGEAAGKYTVYYKVVGDANHSDTAVDSVEVTIAKADPVIGTVGCGMALFNTTATSDIVLTRTDMSVEGVLTLTDNELTAGVGTYNWKFTPKDTDNYNTITGTVTLTVTADVLEKIEASGTLTKSSYVYGDTFSIDGLTVTAVYTSGATKNVSADVSFSNALAVGQTSVVLTYQGKTCEVSGITVARKQLVIDGMSWDVPENAVYNGTEYTATLNGTLPTGVVVTLSGDKATNADSYTAKAVFSLAEGYSADNYEIVNGANLMANWTIAKKNIADAEITLGTALTYNGKEQTQTVASVKIEGLTVTYTVSSNTGTDAKGYTLTVTATGNFEGTATADWSIAKKNISGATITLGDSLTYNGNEQTQEVTEVKIGDLTVTYDVTANKQTNAGNYTLTVTGNGNFEGSATADWSIAKAKLTITANDNSITFGDVPAANGVTGTGFVSSESIEDLSGELAYSYNYEQFGNVGTYKITLSGVTSNNYEITFADGTLTVNAKAITVTADAVSKTYGEADPALTYKVEGLINGDELTGKLKRAAGENIGSYDIEQNTLTAGGNYTITYTGAKLTINAKAITAADVKLNGSLTYNGKEQTQAITVTAGVTYEVTGNKATKAGAYELTVKGTGNYTGSVTLDWTIAKAKLTITADSKVIYIGEKLPTLTYTASGLVGGDKMTKEPTLTTNADADQAGSYTITAANADAGVNYAITYMGGTLTIMDKNTEVKTKVETAALTEVPNGLKSTKFNTVEAIKQELASRIVAASTGFAKENMAHYDVTLQFSLDGGETWILATEENFPTEGITVVLPYPTGTNAENYDFVVSHMFTVTSQRLGTTAGDVELPRVTETASGIRVTLNGLSPVTLAWRATEFDVKIAGTTNGTVSTNVSKATSGTEVTVTVTPKYGYKMATLTVKDASGKSYAVSTDNSGKYYFTMPSADVTVTATFSKISSSTADTTNPKTGDDFQLMLWNSILSISAIFLLAAFADQKRKLIK